MILCHRTPYSNFTYRYNNPYNRQIISWLCWAAACWRTLLYELKWFTALFYRFSLKLQEKNRNSRYIQQGAYNLKIADPDSFRNLTPLRSQCIEYALTRTIHKTILSAQRPPIIECQIATANIVKYTSSEYTETSHLTLCTLQKCAWTGFWIFWVWTPAASNRIKSEAFFAVAGAGSDLDSVFLKKRYWLFAWLIFMRSQTGVELLVSSIYKCKKVKKHMAPKRFV